METKEAYRKKVEGNFKVLGTIISEIEAAIVQTEAESKIEYNKQIEELRNKSDAIQKKLEELKGASDHTWVDLKESIEKAMSDLKNASDRAISKFKRRGE